MSPAVALRLTLPAVVMRLPCTKPCAACTSTVPLPLTVMLAEAPKLTSPEVASTLTEPPAVVSAGVTVTAVPCNNKLPRLVLPVKATAWLTVKAPAAVITTEPLAADTPDKAASVMREVSMVPSALTRLMEKLATVPTSSALASDTATPPAVANTAKV